VKLLPPPGDDKLSIKGEAVVPLSPTLDPPTRGVRILLTGASGATLLDVSIASGANDAVTKTGWKSNSAHTAWTYKSPGTSTAGIQKVGVKVNKKVPGGIKFSVKGSNGTYPITASDVPLTATLVLDVPAATGGQCVEVVFPGTPPASPSCTLADGATLKCN
jgi:hypothetical protein